MLEAGVNECRLNAIKFGCMFVVMMLRPVGTDCDLDILFIDKLSGSPPRLLPQLPSLVISPIDAIWLSIQLVTKFWSINLLIIRNHCVSLFKFLIYKILICYIIHMQLE